MSRIKELKRVSRHKRVGKKIRGTSDRPRLCVHRSLQNIHAQIVDDSKGRVLLGLSTLGKEVKDKVKNGGNIQSAMFLGEALAAMAKGQGITKVRFDRGGYLFHGRIKAFADGARKGGLEF